MQGVPEYVPGWRRFPRIAEHVARKNFVYQERRSHACGPKCMCGALSSTIVTMSGIAQQAPGPSESRACVAGTVLIRLPGGALRTDLTFNSDLVSIGQRLYYKDRSSKKPSRGIVGRRVIFHDVPYT